MTEKTELASVALDAFDRPGRSTTRLDMMRCALDAVRPLIEAATRERIAADLAAAAQITRGLVSTANPSPEVVSRADAVIKALENVAAVLQGRDKSSGPKETG